MKLPLLFILELLIGSINLPAQKRIFDYPKNDKGLKLLVVNTKLVDLNLDSMEVEFEFASYLSSDDNFVVDDKSTIKNLSNRWQGKRAANIYMCWYHYFIYVIKDSQIVDIIRVNTECKQAKTNNGNFDFDSDPFKWLSKYSKIYVVNIRGREKEKITKLVGQVNRDKPDYLIVSGDWEKKVDGTGDNAYIRVIGTDYEYLSGLRRKYMR